MEPIFCDDCRFLEYRVLADSFGMFVCNKNPVIKNTPLRREWVFADPRDKNKLNDCADYAKKKSLLERLLGSK
jgi:hypothetical protein